MVHAVVVGSLVMDLVFRVPRRPEAGEEVMASSFKAYRGGKGYNQAVALARLGADVTLIGAVGADLHGDGFLDALSREGIDSARVVQLRGTPTAVAAPMVTPDGSVAFVHFQGANRRLSSAHCADLPDCDVVLLQGEIPALTSGYVATRYERRGTPVHLHPSPLDDVDATMLNAASVLTPSRAEAAALSGRSGLDDGTELARLLAHKRMAVAVNDGAGEIAWANGDRSGFTAPAPLVVDSTASRDAVVATLAVWMAEGAEFEQAIEYAAAAGRLAAGEVGAEPSLPQRADLEQAVADA